MPRKGKRLSPAQRDKLIGLIVAGFSKQTVIKRMETEAEVFISPKTYEYWRKRSKKEAEDAIRRRREKIYEKSLAKREARLDVLIAQAEKALSRDDVDSVRDFATLSKELRGILQQIATELHEWQTGDTSIIVFNVMTPVLEELARLLVRHIAEGDPRDAALAELRRITQTYLEGLPDAKTIPAKAKTTNT